MVPFLTDVSLILLALMNISFPLLWTADCMALKCLVIFRLWAACVNPLEFIDFLALRDSCGGLMSLFLVQEKLLIVFPSSFDKIWCIRGSLEKGLQEIGDICLQAWRLQSFFSLEEDKKSLIWLLGVSGTDRRSGEEGRRLSMSPRMFLLNGESGMNIDVSSLMWGSGFAGAERAMGNFVKVEES